MGGATYKRPVNRRSFLRLGSCGITALGMGLASCREEPPHSSGPLLSRGALPNVPPADEAPRGSVRRAFSQPNIVYFLSDQHRADCVSAAGFPHIYTPNLSGLAERGIVFGRCYTNAPLCRPARSSMMTGLYPRENRVWSNARSISPSVKNHVQRIRDEGGYSTAVVGKTHLHFGRGHLDRYKCLLDEYGFSHAHELTGPLHVRDTQSAYTDWLTRQTLRGEPDKYQRARRYLFHYVNRFWKRPWALPPPDAYPWLLDPEDHVDLYTGRTAAEWIRGYHGSEPFYLQVNFPGPHNPYDAKRPVELYDLEADPQELVNLINRPELSGLTAKLMEIYENADRGRS